MDPQYRRYNFEKTSPLMCMIKFGPSHEGSPGCAIAAFSSIYFFCQVKRSKFLKSSPPYADTVIGPNSQQWVGSQDEWLSHTLKEPIFDFKFAPKYLSFKYISFHFFCKKSFHAVSPLTKSETACISVGSVHLQLFKA
ncbi:hypothetical protein T01_10951 [Trichinella spiralis]|uniref:Uncharacterized protein n=1 Tax=Trichinella spiralis TaxID=6334 RepID=A0A0V1BZ80_TRISP|nr:hypothetical protein T01_10951 [Trichinella spiralis]